MMKNETIDNIRVENDREHETVADIAAVLRRYVLPSLAERLEAAWKREKAQVGNAAATREALRVADETANELLSWCSNHYQELNCMGSRLKRALEHAAKAPPRNCDRKFIDRVAMYYEFKDWCKDKGHTMEPMLAYDAFDWLLAPAAERKGEGDGSK